jgi:dethiobiotin synthetase
VSVLLITGTGTGVGKTVTTAAIARLAIDRGSSVAVVKPAQTGVSIDEPGDLAEVVRLAPGVECVEFARYAAPLSPEAAARLDRTPELLLDDVASRIDALRSAYDLVLVEGAGGLLVRFASDGWTLADLAESLAAPMLVVTAAGLGTLNHTALTLEVMASRALRFEGLVIGSWPQAPGLAERSNLRDLPLLAGRPLGGAIGEGAGVNGDFLGAARRGLAPAYGGSFDAADFAAAHG